MSRLYTTFSIEFSVGSVRPAFPLWPRGPDPLINADLVCQLAGLEHVVPDELEQADAALEGLRWDDQTICADPERRGAIAVEGEFLKAGVPEGVADKRGEIGWLAVTCPDDAGRRGAELREVTDGPGCPASAPIRSWPCPAHTLIARSGPGGASASAARTCSCTSAKRRPSPEPGSW